MRASATGGVHDPTVAAYLDSILAFVGKEERPPGLRAHRLSSGVYPTTEAEILERYRQDDSCLSEEGLRLVLAACNELEAQASGRFRMDEPADAS